MQNIELLKGKRQKKNAKKKKIKGKRLRAILIDILLTDFC